MTKLQSYRVKSLRFEILSHIGAFIKLSLLFSRQRRAYTQNDNDNCDGLLNHYGLKLYRAFISSVETYLDEYQLIFYVI